VTYEYLFTIEELEKLLMEEVNELSINNSYASCCEGINRVSDDVSNVIFALKDLAESIRGDLVDDCKGLE